MNSISFLHISTVLFFFYELNPWKISVIRWTVPQNPAWFQARQLHPDKAADDRKAAAEELVGCHDWVDWTSNRASFFYTDYVTILDSWWNITGFFGSYSYTHVILILYTFIHYHPAIWAMITMNWEPGPASFWWFHCEWSNIIAGFGRNRAPVNQASWKMTQSWMRYSEIPIKNMAISANC